MHTESIFSVTALIQMAEYHEAQAGEIRRRAERLKQARNYFPFGPRDRSQIVKAGQYLKNLPDFLSLPASEWRNISERFLVEPGEFERYARTLCERERRKIATGKRAAAVKMRARGMRGAQIAAAVGLSPARVSQILNPDPDRARAKAAGLPITVYKRAKAAGTLKPGL